jgi:hypothetical protein
MDELVLALFQGPGFNLMVPLFLFAFGLILGGSAVRSLARGKIDSAERMIVRDEQPLRFRRSILVTAALALLFHAGAAYGLVRPGEFRTGLHLAMPLVWLIILAAALYRGVAFSWSRAEQPRLYWCGIAMIVFMLATSVDGALAESTRSR